MSALPLVLQAALDAEAARKANDHVKHPRIDDRLWHREQAARAALRRVYPQLDEWLFGYPYRNQAERFAELERLLQEARS